MADLTYGPKVYRQQGGDRQVVASGGSCDVESGGEIDIESGGAFKIAGTDRTSALSTAPGSVSAGSRVVFGTMITAGVTDAVTTGLTTVTSCIAFLNGAPAIGITAVTAATSAVAGQIIISGWAPTSTANTTPTTASTYTKTVSWAAWGT